MFRERKEEREKKSAESEFSFLSLSLSLFFVRLTQYSMCVIINTRVKEGKVKVKTFSSLSLRGIIESSSEERSTKPHSASVVGEWV